MEEFNRKKDQERKQSDEGAMQPVTELERRADGADSVISGENEPSQLARWRSAEPSYWY
jgi:hypothetical protein